MYPDNRYLSNTETVALLERAASFPRACGGRERSGERAVVYPSRLLSLYVPTFGTYREGPSINPEKVG